MVADRPLGKPEQGLQLADADRLAVGAQELVDDPQPVSIGKRLEDGLKLGGALIVKGGASKGRAAFDHRKFGHGETVALFIDEFR
jgi:hypothetical protein